MPQAGYERINRKEQKMIANQQRERRRVIGLKRGAMSPISLRSGRGAWVHFN